MRQGMEATGVWDDGEVSFSYLTHLDQGEAAEALDTGGRRARSQSGAKEQVCGGKARRVDEGSLG